MKKVQVVLVKSINGILLFAAGALVDPNVAKFVGDHRGVATAVTLGLLALRLLDKELGGTPPA